MLKRTMPEIKKVVKGEINQFIDSTIQFDVIILDVELGTMLEGFVSCPPAL